MMKRTRIDIGIMKKEVKLIGLEMVVLAYRCPDPECGSEHTLLTIGKKEFDFPGVEEKLHEAVALIIEGMAAELADKFGGKVESVQKYNPREMN